MIDMEIFEGERIDDLQCSGLYIIQNKNGFCFGIDAVLLSSFAKVKRGEKALDMCTGNGVIPLLLYGKTNGEHFTGIEIQTPVAEMAQRSVIMNEVSDKIQIINDDIKNLCNYFKLATFNVVTCNPPYMAQGVGAKNDHSPKAIARHEIMCNIDDIFENANKMLKFGGRLYMVHRAERLTDIFYSARNHRLEPKVMQMIQPYANKAPNLVLIEFAKGGKPPLKNLEPIIVYNQDGTYTEQLKKMYYMSEIKMLYICGTPIGNLEDMTYRVVRVLSEVDLIAAEDTRQSVKLLNHFDIKTPLTSYYEHNKDVKGPQLIKLLQEGKDIALVTDAGMPGISDPGEDLIKLCYENNVPVTVVPGPTAVVTALVLSGLNSRSYIFEGFLPRNKKQRAEVLERLVDESRTTVFYEAPHHLVDTLDSIYKTVGDRNIAVARELTKKHETVNRGAVGEVLEYFKENEPKGEFVLVLEGKDKEKIKEDKIASFEEMTIEEHFNMYIEQGMSEKDAMKQVAKDRGIGKRDVYAYIKK